MIKVRIETGWFFGDTNFFFFFKFVDFAKQLKIGLSVAGKYYLKCGLHELFTANNKIIFCLNKIY